MLKKLLKIKLVECTDEVGFIRKNKKFEKHTKVLDSAGEKDELRVNFSIKIIKSL